MDEDADVDVHFDADEDADVHFDVDVHFDENADGDGSVVDSECWVVFGWLQSLLRWIYLSYGKRVKSPADVQLFPLREAGCLDWAGVQTSEVNYGVSSNKKQSIPFGSDPWAHVATMVSWFYWLDCANDSVLPSEAEDSFFGLENFKID